MDLLCSGVVLLDSDFGLSVVRVCGRGFSEDSVWLRGGGLVQNTLDLREPTAEA